jgi:hypothetical protein
VLRLQQVDDDAYLHNELLRLNKSEARVILLYSTQSVSSLVYISLLTSTETLSQGCWLPVSKGDNKVLFFKNSFPSMERSSAIKRQQIITPISEICDELSFK